MPKTNSASKLDWIEDSKKFLLIAVFGKSSSPMFGQALTIAERAAVYQKERKGGQEVYCCAFERSKEGAVLAHTLSRLAMGWTSTQFFAGGRLVAHKDTVEGVLGCYLEASHCDNWKAHCLEIVDDPSFLEETSLVPLQIQNTVEAVLSVLETLSPDWAKQDRSWEKVERYVLPCRRLGWGRLRPDGPATYKEQVQAKSVRSGCDWCPYFDLDQFRQLGVEQARIS